jgi:DNA polymerase III subunit epsilon
MARSLEYEKFVCVDCETTGLDTQKDRIIEVAVITFTFGETFEEYETLVDPKQEIPQVSIEIHHISQEMVEGKPLIQEVLPQVLKLIGRNIIIGHGIQYDIDIITAEAKRHGVPCTISNNQVIDTLRLARLYGDSPSNALERLGIHFNVESEGHHRAMNDVRVNIEVFKHLSIKFRNLAAVFKALSKPIMLKKMPLGKHKGRPFRDIPIQYLRWAANKDFDQDLLFSLRSEIKKRKQGNLFEQSGNPFADLDL